MLLLRAEGYCYCTPSQGYLYEGYGYLRVQQRSNLQCRLPMPTSMLPMYSIGTLACSSQGYLYKG